MASGNGTKIHRRLQSGDLLTPLLAVRSFSEEPGHWGGGPGQLNPAGQAKAGVSSFFGQDPSSILPPLPQEAIRSSEAGAPLDLTLYLTPDPGRQRLLLANLARSGQRPRNVVTMKGSSPHLYL